MLCKLWCCAWVVSAGEVSCFVFGSAYVSCALKERGVHVCCMQVVAVRTLSAGEGCVCLRCKGVVVPRLCRQGTSVCMCVSWAVASFTPCGCGCHASCGCVSRQRVGVCAPADSSTLEHAVQGSHLSS